MNKIRTAFLSAAVAISALAASVPPAAAAGDAAGSSAVVADSTSKLPEEAKLDDLNNQVEQANGQLDILNLKLAADASKEALISTQLRSLARLEYKQPILVMQFMRANSLSQMLGDIARARLISDKEAVLMRQAHALRLVDQKARDEQAAQVAVLKTAREEAAAAAKSARATADAEFRARAEAIAAAAAAQAAQQPRWAVAQPPAPPVIPSGASGPNRFTYGYCTWYVANRRYIPWLGNAIDWWPNARAYGFAEGGVPAVGAVMVTRESGYGHVAYVESVRADGSWTVSEMNFVGWNVISSRTIRPGQVPLVGFIYGK
ncbi:MAG: hypothetical protein NVS9B1_22570 [Candidatus Dormibacteraceae bacterium]